MKPYIQQKLEYTEDGRLLDERGYSVMMDWETKIMEESAKVITANKGDILNIGFGMGIIDGFIQKQKPRTHTIIECHPDVQRKMIKEGWLEKKNVKVIFDKWQNVYKELPKYDGIYIDTWDETVNEFHENVHKLLKIGGTYSWFNNPRNQEKTISEHDFRLLNKELVIQFKLINIDHVPPPETQTGSDRFYWHPSWTKYYIPIITFKKNNKLWRDAERQKE